MNKKFGLLIRFVMYNPPIGNNNIGKNKNPIHNPNSIANLFELASLPKYKK